jgi:hypothetical protein
MAPKITPHHNLKNINIYKTVHKNMIITPIIGNVSIKTIHNHISAQKNIVKGNSKNPITAPKLRKAISGLAI